MNDSHMDFSRCVVLSSDNHFSVRAAAGLSASGLRRTHEWPRQTWWVCVELAGFCESEFPAVVNDFGDLVAVTA